MAIIILSFIAENWLNLLLVVVGLSAFGVYFWQKRDDKKTAATLLKSQIDSIEKIITVLKEDHRLGNLSVYHSRQIINESLWDKYKHLFVKLLSQSEVEIIQKFFDNAEQIERARHDILHTITMSWEHHSFVQHYYATLCTREIEIEDGFEFQQSSDKLDAFEEWLKNHDLTYTSNIAIDALVNNLRNFTLLSGTTAYQKIQKHSFDK